MKLIQRPKSAVSKPAYGNPLRNSVGSQAYRDASPGRKDKITVDHMLNNYMTNAEDETHTVPLKDHRPFDDEKEINIGGTAKDFVIICELGRGSYGVVYKVQSNIDSNVYVMKKINLKHLKRNSQAEALKEAQILKQLRHPNIIRYYTSFMEDDTIHIVMEYAERGDLHAVTIPCYVIH